MELYEFGPTRSLRARWTLQELGVEFEGITLDLQAGANQATDFLALNPAGKLPVLVDGDVVVPESIAIVLYLAEKFPEKGLMPKDLGQRAQAYRWLLFAATELEQPLWRISRNTFVYPEEKRLAADVPLAAEDFRPMAAVAEQHMRGREFVVGDRVSVVDFVMAYTLDWAQEAELLGGFPTLVSYVDRMYARPRATPRIAEAFARVSQS